MADDQAHWAAQLLATSIQASGLSERELEKRLGWKKGALGKILHNGSALRHQQVLDILEVLSRDGREIQGWKPAETTDVGGPLVGTLLERFRRLGYPVSEPPAPSGEPPQGEELERRVEEILVRAFGRLEALPDDEE